MYRVLLVDDEENVLEILKKTIQWQEMGVEQALYCCRQSAGVGSVGKVFY